MDSSLRKRLGWGLIILCGMAGVAASAPREMGTSESFGAGVSIGEPTGLTAKRWLTRTRAVDLALGFDLSGQDDRFEVHGDHLWHFPLKMSNLEGRPSLYVGLGGRLLTGHDARVGVRGPLGASYLFPKQPIELFAEITPLLDLTPDADIRVNGGVGARYYFR